MLPYIRIAALLRNARSSLSAGNYLDAINYAASLLSLFGFDSEAAKISALITDVKNGDAEKIANDVLAMLADVVALVFSKGKPVTVGLAEMAVVDRLDSLATQSDQLATPTVGAAADTGAVDPQTVIAIIQIAQQAFAFFWDRYQKNHAA